MKKQLLFWRRPGTFGPLYAPLGKGVYAHTKGNYLGEGGPGHPGTTIPVPYFCIDFSKATLNIPAINNPVMLLNFNMATLVPCKDTTEPDIVATTVTLTGSSFHDMDANGKPDTLIASDPPTFVTANGDSVNIDLDGDHIADVVIDR